MRMPMYRWGGAFLVLTLISPVFAETPPSPKAPAPERLWKYLPVYTPTQDESAKKNVLVYAVHATLQDLEKWYVPRLEAHGWKLTKRAAFETSKFGGPAVNLNVEGESRAASIWIAVNTKDKLTYVTLACFGKAMGECPDN